ncbi:unnamed protein product [Taenia asiatica]|uniref:BPI1 domain-containing protein n=1 Tax=Taenia asiatica TaxID=60517 RepID=A0A0R3VUI4_TAEAS|nr:unnamed protein product [Taenia asiatica]
MKPFHLIGILLLLTLLPVSILAHSSNVQSIIDSILIDIPQYLPDNAAKFHVQSVEHIVRSCPFSFHETLLDGQITSTFGICINATGLVLTPPILLVNKVTIERTKLDISVQVKKAVHPEIKAELLVPVLDGIHVKALGFFTFSANYIKGIIIKEAKKRIEIEIRALIAALR